MTSIPLTIDGLRQRYEFNQRVEDEFRDNFATARRLLKAASRDRLTAFRAWQRALKERGEAKAR